MTTFGFFLLHWLQRAIVATIGFFIFMILAYFLANIFSEIEFPDLWLPFDAIICGILGIAVSFSIAVSDCFAKTDIQKGLTILLLSFIVGAMGGIVLDGFETGFNEIKQSAFFMGTANIFLAVVYSMLIWIFSPLFHRFFSKKQDGKPK